MYLIKSLLFIFTLFYTYTAITVPCEDKFHPNKPKQLNGTTDGVTESSNGIQPTESPLETINQEQSAVWESLFSHENLISINDLPQLTRKEQIDLMYKIVSLPEYSVFDVRERIKWLKVLFANGVDVNTQNESGEGLLHIVVRMRGIGGQRLLRTLLENGADAHVKDRAGQIPVEIAHAHNNHKMVKLLQSQL